LTIRRSTSDIDLGFGIYDYERYNKPKVQILTPREPPKEQQVKYCSSCDQKIEWIETSRRFICYSCGVSYHELYDTPLSSVDQAIHPLQSNDPYERIEPAIISAKPDRRLQGERTNKHISISGDLRRARVHVDGSPLLATEEVIRKELGEDSAYGY
jgi:hypothetical protein